MHVPSPSSHSSERPHCEAMPCIPLLLFLGPPCIKKYHLILQYHCHYILLLLLFDIIALHAIKATFQVVATQAIYPGFMARTEAVISLASMGCRCCVCPCGVFTCPPPQQKTLARHSKSLPGSLNRDLSFITSMALLLYAQLTWYTWAS